MAPPDPTVPTGRIVVRSRVRFGAGAAVVLVIVAVAVAVLVAMLGSSGVSSTVSPSDGTGGPAPSNGQLLDPEASGRAAGIVLVHLLGAVAAPGLYELRSGDRVVDAVAAAGGFVDEADQAAVNLARVVSDGEQIFVPRVGEVPPATSAPGASGSGRDGKVDLNTADEAALDTLPGVGPATARSILEWRESNGRFTAIEDLLSVSGIGDKTFADLKDHVTV